MEKHMDVHQTQDAKPKYKTPRWVQAWFLGRSRELWKQKYKELKTVAKRLQNRVNDTSKSRESWRMKAEALAQRVRELEMQNAALQEAVALKKYRPSAAG
jgi:chromosome segregation ATPase